MYGETSRIIPAYEAWQAQRNVQREQVEACGHSELPVRIISLELLNELPCSHGDDLCFRLRTESSRDDLPFHVTLSIKMSDGRGVYATGTHLSGRPPLSGKQREILITYPHVRLLGGLYSAHARIFDNQGLMLYHEKVLPDVEVRKDSQELGICYLENLWEIN
ncbi:MAG: hypothetical protein CSA09_05200 [Candidatus Contendobacter odensis]|uniref:Wzt C-terminal domain-containing protein n=1 Tax=Candidatus Contendibacter odensensis TaxID=1400860 RepID=A0A2G6PF53_9GAMM|nr:MAG: hypothetical protein CSA09_05200 [Candidatus Contendobacter odensis]